MSKWLLVLTSLFVLLTGCQKDRPKDEQPVKKTAIEEKKNRPTEETSSDPNTKEEKTDKQETPKPHTLLDYRPEVGITKRFFDNGNLLYTEKIIAVNDQYVQRVIELGGSVTVQVLKWTDKEISVVYESESDHPSKNILDTFQPQGEESLLLKSEGNQDMKILDTKASVTVPSGSFEKVYIVKVSTHEVAGAESYHTYYLAPGTGIIKEIYEITGDQGYTAGSELKEISK